MIKFANIKETKWKIWEHKKNLNQFCDRENLFKCFVFKYPDTEGKRTLDVLWDSWVFQSDFNLLTWGMWLSISFTER